MLTAPFDDREKGRYFLPDSALAFWFSSAPTSLFSLFSAEAKSMLMLSDLTAPNNPPGLGWTGTAVQYKMRHKNCSPGNMKKCQEDN